MILEDTFVELVQDIWCDAHKDVAMREIGPEQFIHSPQTKVGFKLFFRHLAIFKLL